METLTTSEIKTYAEQVGRLFNLAKISLFGSYAKGVQTPESDIDLLVDFGKDVSIYTLAKVKLKMEEMSGKEVDVIATPIPEDSLLEIDKEVLLYDKQG